MQNTQPSGQRLPLSTHLAPLFSVALAVLMAVAIGAYALRSLSSGKENSDCYEQEVPPGDQGPNDYTKWQKPDVAIILSGQMFGFYDPCGCSEPQHGGLVRRYNFIQSLKDKGWSVVGIDLGELPSLKGIPKQNMLKYELSVRSLGAMGYRAMGIGRDEILSPLGEALVQIEDNRKPFPRPINISLDHTEPKAKYHDLNVRPYEIIGDTNPKIGVINLMGPDLRDELKTLEKFLPNDKQLPKALNAFAEEGVEVGVILLHEYPNLDPKLFPKGSKKRLDKMEELRIEQATKVAEFCAAERKNNAKIPPIQVMMILTHEPDTESEPRSIMRPLDKLDTQVIEIGHKGKYVGLLGVYRGAKGIELRYQMVQMTPDWKTKEGAEKGNAVIALLENYNKHLKDEKMLDQYKRTQHFNQIDNQGRLKATYVGSAACFGCHPQARKVWTGPEKDAPHYIATDALEKLKHPSGRQYDPECMMCHTTGFKHHGGYNDLILNLAKKQAPNAQQIADHNKSLRGVGCESCHGPGSEHVKLEKDDAKGKEKLYPFINPYGLTKEERDLEAKEAAKAASPKEQVRLKLLFDERMRKMAQNLCMKCHDHDNDVNWGQPGKDTADKWRPLIHRTPGAGVALPKAKDNDGPAVVDPPIVIEVIPEKKK